MMQELFPVVGRPSLHQMMKKILIKSSQRPKCFCSSFCFLYLVQFSFLPSVLNNSLVWSAETEEVCSCHVKLFKHTAEAICCLAQRRDFVSAWGLSSLSSDRVTTRKLCCVKPLNIHWMCSFGKVHSSGPHYSGPLETSTAKFVVRKNLSLVVHRQTRKLWSSWDQPCDRGFSQRTLSGFAQGWISIPKS